MAILYVGEANLRDDSLNIDGACVRAFHSLEDYAMWFKAVDL